MADPVRPDPRVKHLRWVLDDPRLDVPCNHRDGPTIAAVLIAALDGLAADRDLAPAEAGTSSAHSGAQTLLGRVSGAKHEPCATPGEYEECAHGECADCRELADADQRVDAAESALEAAREALRQIAYGHNNGQGFVASELRIIAHDALAAGSVAPPDGDTT